MTSIVLSSNYLSPADFKLSELGKDPFLFGLGGGAADHIKPYTPYCMGKPSTQDAAIVASLSDAKTAKFVTDSCKLLGVDCLLSLSETYSGLHSGGTTMAGAALSNGSDAHRAFVKSLGALEDAYKAMHQSRSNPTQYAAAKSRAEALSKSINTFFAAEVNRITATVKSKKGVPLKDFSRAENIVKSSRNLDKLNFLDFTQAKNLGVLSKGMSFLGNGIVVMDLGVGALKTNSAYKNNENWHRTMFVESTKLFAASSGALMTASAIGAISVAIGLTPIGWVAIVVVGAVAAYKMTQIADKEAGTWYDGLMEWLE